MFSLTPRRAALLAAVALLAISMVITSCGGSGKRSSEPPTTTSTTASTTTTTLAKGETSSLAQFTTMLPAAYDYVDAPQAVVNEMLSAMRTDPQTAAAITGVSAHSVVRKGNQQTIAIMILVDIEAQYAALPRFKEAMLAALAPSGKSISIAGKNWVKESSAGNPTTYATTYGNIAVVVLGENEVATEAFLAAFPTS